MAQPVLGRKVYSGPKDNSFKHCILLRRTGNARPYLFTTYAHWPPCVKGAGCEADCGIVT